MYRVIDLFAGVGGMSLGAASAGFSVTGAVELDPDIFSSHKKNFTDTVHLLHDISLLTGDKLLNEVKFTEGGLDGLIGGPPCQGFSGIGRQDIHDPRNELFIHFYRLVKELQPRFFVAENVPGILSDKYSGVIDIAEHLIRDHYHILDPVIIRANDCGAPTDRKRVFFVGYKKADNFSLKEESFYEGISPKRSLVRDAFAGLPVRTTDSSPAEDGGWQTITPPPRDTYAHNLSYSVPQGVGDPECLRQYFDEHKVSGFAGTRHTNNVVRRFSSLHPGQTDSVSRSKRLELDGLCPTLRAGTGSDRGSYQAVRPIHPTEPRVITTREAARIQGFPDWFQFHSTKWHSFRQIGNSVSPLVSRFVLSKIMSALTNTEVTN